MTATDVAEKPTALSKRGTKQTCENEDCGYRFYDLKRTNPACPYCGESHEVLAVETVDFETLVKPQTRKFNRWQDPNKAKVEQVVVDDEAEKEEDKDSELPSAGEELLIENEDDDDTETPVANTSDGA